MSSAKPPALNGIYFAIAAAQSCPAFSAWTLPLQIVELTTRYSWSAAMSGVITTGQLLLTSGIMILVAPYLAAIHPKRMVLLGTSLAAGGFTLVAVSPSSIGFAVAGLLLCGAGQGLAAAGAAALAAVSKDRVRAYSIGMSSSIVFSALALLLLPRLDVHIGNNSSTFVGCALAMLICFIVAASAGVKAAVGGRPAAEPRSRTLSWRMGMPLAANFLLFAACTAVWSFAANIGLRGGLREGAISVTLSLAAVASALGPLIAATCAGRRRLSGPLFLGFASTAAALLVTCVLVTHLGFVIGLVVQAIGQIALSVLVFDLNFRADATGRLSTIGGSFVILGCAIGPALGGALYSYGPGALGGASALLLVLAWLAIAAFEGSIETSRSVDPVSGSSGQSA